jgi:hypothetical protein
MRMSLDTMLVSAKNQTQSYLDEHFLALSLNPVPKFFGLVLSKIGPL